MHDYAAHKARLAEQLKAGTGDLALRKAVADLYGGLDVQEARDRFHPFENLSAHYLLLASRIP